MNDTVKKVCAGVACVLVGAGLGGLAVDVYHPDAVQVEVDKLVEVQVDNPDTIKELADCEASLELANEDKDLVSKDLVDANDKLDDYAEVISEAMDEDSAVGEVMSFMEDDEDFKEDLKEKLNGLGYDVEDVEDLVYVKLLDNDDLEVDVDRDDNDEVDGTVVADVKSKFYENGEDGDRHRETVRVEFELDDGEVEDYKFLEE